MAGRKLLGTLLYRYIIEPSWPLQRDNIDKKGNLANVIIKHQVNAVQPGNCGVAGQPLLFFGLGTGRFIALSSSMLGAFFFHVTRSGDGAGLYSLGVGKQHRILAIFFFVDQGGVPAWLFSESSLSGLARDAGSQMNSSSTSCGGIQWYSAVGMAGLVQAGGRLHPGNEEIETKQKAQLPAWLSTGTGIHPLACSSQRQKNAKCNAIR